jgi:hypothetical protein
MKTPVTQAGLRRYDHLPAAEAVKLAWSDPGSNLSWHRKMQALVEEQMPLLARALDRLQAGPG